MADVRYSPDSAFQRNWAGGQNWWKDGVARMKQDSAKLFGSIGLTRSQPGSKKLALDAELCMFPSTLAAWPAVSSCFLSSPGWARSPGAKVKPGLGSPGYGPESERLGGNQKG